MTAAASLDRQIAFALVKARRAAQALDAFPGPLPDSLDDAYAIQRATIDLWGDDISGWKVGRLSPELADRFGVDRFIGPVFKSDVEHVAPDTPARFAVFNGGYGAFEAEFVATVGFRSVIPEVASLTTGIEVAASPVRPLPVLGSLATIADMGNNAGLLIGTAVPAGCIAVPAELCCTTRVDGADPISRSAAALPGGPLAAFAFAAVEARRLGLPLREGQFISTGAVTGMNPVHPGQTCSADFGEFGRIDCGVVARPPVAGWKVVA